MINFEYPLLKVLNFFKKKLMLITKGFVNKILHLNICQQNVTSKANK